ncbi:MAG TPA: hypothetical protein VMJ73_01495 [Rhizomicrobium sp.]|jgi:CHASE2 domain-containing sensor protein|nr:hypothetical protein [Rhizomicrobium sp.]
MVELRTKAVLIALLFLALLMTAVGSIVATNWVARTPPLAMLVVLAVTAVYILSERKSTRPGPWGKPGT